MLSYIRRSIEQFERQHGIQPNLLYLNEIHVKELKVRIAEPSMRRSISDLLQMEMVVNKEITHPHVAWTQSAHRIAV